MKLILMFLCTILFSCCVSPPRDNTPVWSKNNRHAVEMKNTCNTTKHSIGISGCAFFEDEIKGQLIFPPLLKGRLSFESSSCKDFTRNQNSQNLELDFASIYSNPNGVNCSYKVLRTVDNIKKFPFDHVMIGRFFIKIIPDNAYYEKLNFKVNGEEFSGVGWAQEKHLADSTQLTIEPSGQAGTFRMNCGETEFMVKKYSTGPFTIDMRDAIGCDYEMVATNSDSPEIEFGSFVFERQGLTLDLTRPVTYVKKGKRYFSFRDKNREGKFVVYAVTINDARYIKKNFAYVKDNRMEYEVKGYTLSGRMFYGIYNVKTQKWEVK